MTPQPVPPHLIKPPPTDIFMDEFRGVSRREERERREAKWRAWVQSPSRVRRLIGRIAVARRLG